MELRFAPIAPWHLIVTGSAVAVTLVVIVLLLLRRAPLFSQKRAIRVVIVALLLLAFGLFIIAGWNPILTTVPDPARTHLVVLADVSESVLRAPDSWLKIRDVSTLLEQSIQKLEPEQRARSYGSIVTFGEGPRDFQTNLRITQLPATLRQLDARNMASNSSTDIAAGLKRAGELIQSTGGQGVVLLISDGNELTGDARSAAQQLAQRGIPVHVLPVFGSAPRVGIASADLPRQVNGGAKTFMRALLSNSQEHAAEGTVIVQANVGMNSESRFASEEKNSAAPIAPSAQSFLSWDLEFHGAGIQFADLAWIPQDGSGEQRRRFFTHVLEPLRLLVIGGDNSWLPILPAGMFEAEQIEPLQLPNYDLAEWDAVVLSAVSAEQFPPGALDALANAVSKEGVGLMVMNGGPRSTNPEVPTILMSYDKTPIEALLPVISGPRPFMDEPPERNVVFAIDRSGSMSGVPLALAKAIAYQIIQTEMRPADHLYVLFFDTESELVVSDLVTDPQGKVRARQLMDPIGIGGGTDPTKVLQAIGGRRLAECGLILITDLGFDLNILKRQRPECQRTIFAIGHDSIPSDPNVQQFGQVIPAPHNFDPSSVRLTYFEPEERKKFFEEGEFTLLQTDSWGRQARADSLPVPELEMNGSAVTHIKPDKDPKTGITSATELEGVRDQPIDPVLAYRANGAGYVGVLTSAIPTSWQDDPVARQAVGAWLKRLIAYQARNRYDFKIVDSGQRLRIQVAIKNPEATGESTAAILPQVIALEGAIEIGGNVVARKFVRDPEIPATFSATFDVPRTTEAREGMLVLTESGRDALLRPQRIRIIIPPASSISATPATESFSAGLNEELLRDIAEMGGGIYEPKPGDLLLSSRSETPIETPVWQYFLVAGLVALLISIGLERLRL